VSPLQVYLSGLGEWAVQSVSDTGWLLGISGELSVLAILLQKY